MQRLWHRLICRLRGHDWGPWAAEEALRTQWMRIERRTSACAAARSIEEVRLATPI